MLSIESLNLTQKIFLCILIVSSWFRAGLELAWFDQLWLFIFGFLLFRGMLAKGVSHKSLGILVGAVCSCAILIVIPVNNSAFKTPTAKQLADLDIESYLSKEKNIKKAVAISDTLKRTLPYFDADPQRALTLYLHSKNELEDSYPVENRNLNVLDKILSLIWSAPHPYLPSQIINHKDTLNNHLVFLSQLLIGIVAYLLFNTRRSIRKFITGLVISSTLLAVAGIVQKIQYFPADNLKEIWGIWDTPEPRYFYASFTYKNHWSAYALLSISVIAGLLIHAFNSKNSSFYLNGRSIFFFFGLIALTTTIPHCGSRSGFLIFLTLLILIIFSIRFKIRKSSNNKNTYKITLTLIAVLVAGFFISKSTTREMITTTTSQIKSKEKPLRILLWSDLLKQISGKTFWGYGYDSYGTINPVFQSHEIRVIRNKGIKNAHNHYVPLVGHGHSDLLEYLSEFGWVGFSFIALPTFLLILRNFMFCPSLLVQSISAGCLCFIVYCCVDFPTRTPACLILFSVLVGISSKYTSLSFSK